MAEKGKPMEIVSVRGKEIRRTPGWCIACRTVGLLLLVLQLVLLFINGTGRKLLLGGLNQPAAYFLLDAAMIACGIFSIHWRRRTGYWLTGIPALLLVVLYGVNVFSYGKDVRYFEYRSPRGTETLVAEENAFLFRGDIRFFQRENALFLRDTGASIHFDDGYQSLGSGSFSLRWTDEKTVEVECSGAQNSTAERKLTVRLYGDE